MGVIRLGSWEQGYGACVHEIKINCCLLHVQREPFSYSKTLSASNVLHTKYTARHHGEMSNTKDRTVSFVGLKQPVQRW